MNEGQERMHRVDKMDTEGNSKGKLEIWKEEELGWDGGRKYHGLGLGTI